MGITLNVTPNTVKGPRKDHHDQSRRPALSFAEAPLPKRHASNASG
jgi:hypothetical protein